jgi:hypothetical protein
MLVILDDIMIIFIETRSTPASKSMSWVSPLKKGARKKRRNVIATTMVDHKSKGFLMPNITITSQQNGCGGMPVLVRSRTDVEVGIMVFVIRTRRK